MFHGPGGDFSKKHPGRRRQEKYAMQGSIAGFNFQSEKNACQKHLDKKNLK
jgi:hypothetical protein